MEAGLRLGDALMVARHAQALRRFMGDEPLPLAELFIERATLLASTGDGETDAGRRQRYVERLRAAGLDESAPWLPLPGD